MPFPAELWQCQIPVFPNLKYVWKSWPFKKGADFHLEGAKSSVKRVQTFAEDLTVFITR